MPGTHYDNDHSFIEELPFDLKVVAYRIIRSDSLAFMLKSLQKQQHGAFESVFIENLKTADITRVIHACIIAKVTSFEKTLYINPDHEMFLHEVLFHSLNELLRRFFDDRNLDEETILHYVKISHPQTYFWIHKTDADSKRRLAIRKRRENTRRYFRYKAKLKYHFIRIGSHENVPELAGDIYSTGIQHFTKIVNGKLDLLRQDYKVHIAEALHEKHPQAHGLFLQVLQRLEHLREILNGISVGRLPLTEAKTSLKDTLAAPLSHTSLQGNIRTESMLRELEAKIQQINANTLILLENSSPHRLYEGPVLEKLKIDRDIQVYKEKEKQNHSNLLKAFIDLYYYTALLEKIYNNISASNFVIIYPEYWSENYYNASTTSFAIHSEFLVEVNDILELFIQINLSCDKNNPKYEILHQRCKVVRIDEHLDKGYYQISCQFLTPTEHNMTIISKALQSQEVIEAFEAADFLEE